MHALDSVGSVAESYFSVSVRGVGCRIVLYSCQLPRSVVELCDKVEVVKTNLSSSSVERSSSLVLPLEYERAAWQNHI